MRHSALPLNEPASSGDTLRNLFVALVCVLLGFGVLMVHSASVTSWPTEFDEIAVSRHLVFLLIGVVAGLVCAALPASTWPRIAPWLMAVTLLLLVAVLIPGVGVRVNGAQRWLRYAGISMQPSELAKIALPLTVAVLFSGRRMLSRRLGSLVLTGMTVGLVARQPDLGTAVFLALSAGLTLFIAGWPLRYFAIAALAGTPVVVWLMTMKAYQLQRITGFLAAWTGLENAPWQMKQSILSLGAGGISGVGVGRGLQKLSFLPESNTDFVFAVVGEELGLLGTLGLIGIWGAVYFVGLRLLSPLPRTAFSYVAGVTLLTQVVLQAALNVAVVTAMVPPKGIAHPLVSYGGSSLVVTLMALGIVVSMSRGEEVGTAAGMDPERP